MPLVNTVARLVMVLCAAATTANSAFAGDAKAEGGEADQIFDLPYLMRDLDNGLRVIVVPTDYPDVVSLQIPVQTGSRNEVEPGKSGFAHFFEHMMFRGTERHPPEVYKQVLKNAGADQNAYTTDDYTNYHITFTKADLERVIALEADRFQNLSYSEEQFRTEALAVKGEYLKNYSNPVQKAFERIREVAFDTHTYRHTTMGFLADIEQMPNQLEYSRTFFDRWYRPEKTAVILVGDVDPEQTFALVKKYWGDWERGSYDVDIPAEPPPDGPVYEHVQWEAPNQPWVFLAFRGPAWDPRMTDMPAVDVISQLYFAESSDVYQKLVTQEQVVDQLWTYFPDRKDPNLLLIAARLSVPEKAPYVRDQLLATLARVRSEPVDPQRLEDTKSRLRYGFASQLDNSESIGDVLAAYVHFERTPEVINALYRSYAAITPEDLIEVADRYFNDEGLVLLTLSNDEAMAGMSDFMPLASRVSDVERPSTGGIKLVQLRSAASPLVDVSFLFATGAAFDPPGKKGLAAVTAAMVADAGSERHTIEEIEQAMYPMAASFSAQVDKEMTRLSGTVHKDLLADFSRLMLEQLLTPGWRDSDLERIKTQTGNEIRTDLVGNNDEELGKEALYEFIYGPDHPYGSLNIGHSSDVGSITMDDVKRFYTEHYAQANLVVGLAGGYPEDYPAELRERLARLPAEPAASLQLGPPPAIDGRHAVIIEKQTPAVAVSFGFPIELRRGDPGWVALWLARSWLGEHRSSNSHLYQRIREARGMNYGDYAYIEYFPNGMFLTQPEPNMGRSQQIFQVWLRPLRNNSDAHFATRAALYELDKLIEDGMSEEDFEATRNFLDKYVSLLLKTQSRQLGYRLDSDYYGVEAFTDYVRGELAELTVDKVNAVVREHLQVDDIKFVFVSADASDLIKRLISDAPSPLEYNTPKPELAAEDAVIANLALGLDQGRVRTIPAAEIFSGAR